ncbi:MAG: DUF5618 family protein [Nitrospirae bacterium]|nr:DUF5618 family protein [Nitrospirota bacterium]
MHLDKKPVREAFGTAYLAILEAINEALIKKGLTHKELPKSVDGYIAAIKKHLSVNNGKLVRETASMKHCILPDITGDYLEAQM